MLCPRQAQRILTRHNHGLRSIHALCGPHTTKSSTPQTNTLFPRPLQPHLQPSASRPASSSSSSTRWKSRQGKDHFARDAKVAGLKSRAAYKLLELDQKHRLFRRGGTVVDLGYAPGSWSQVAVNRTTPGGRVVGIDVIPAQPPRGASAIQGNFLSEAVQAEVRSYVKDYWRGRPRKRGMLARRGEDGEDVEQGEEGGVQEEEMEKLRVGLVGLNTAEEVDDSHVAAAAAAAASSPPDDMEKATKVAGLGKASQDELDDAEGRVVDVVLSDMSAPWDQTNAMWVRSVSNPYYRMMNTSGMPFRDHAGSMDLCNAGLSFCYDTLRTGGHYLCKFYQGAEDKAFELRLKKLFEKVHREKPESSRKESKEAYFVALRRRPDIPRADVFPDED